MKRKTNERTVVLIAAMIVIVAASTQLKAATGTCGSGTTTLPFTDVPSNNAFFCSIATAYFSGLTNGTTATTYTPTTNVPREQMAAFVTRTLDQAVKRGSRRAALSQFWTNNLALTDVGGAPLTVKSDGANLWVPNFNTGTVKRVKASDGRVLETWTGATAGFGVVVAKGKAFVTGATNPGALYQIDPAEPAGAVTLLTDHLGSTPEGIAFDGARIWTANDGGSVSIVSFLSHVPSVNTVTTGFVEPEWIIFDGSNIWVSDFGDSSLKKLDSTGHILLSAAVGARPSFPVFDGTNIWVPNILSDSISVVRATGALSGTVLATLSGNGLNQPSQAAFDGERILVTNYNGDSVSLWKASDLTPIGTFPMGTGTQPRGVCSDGLNFWVTFQGTGKLARF